MKGDKRKVIYNSAKDLFGKFGVRKVSVDMIVEKSGIAKGTFYLYFKNKERLYEDIVDDILANSMESMKRAVEHHPILKERLIYKFVGSLIFFEKNDIIRNLAHGNKDYFAGKIDSEYTKMGHIEMLKILLKDSFENDQEVLMLLSGLIGFYSNLPHMKDCFTNEEQFMTFAINFASIIVNGFFAEFKNDIKDFNLKHLESEINKIK